MLVSSKPLIKSLYYCFAMLTQSFIILTLSGYLLSTVASYSSESQDHGHNLRHFIHCRAIYRIRHCLQKMGCRSGLQELGENYREIPTNNSILQNPSGVFCSSLKLNHVSILVKVSTWIPDSLNNLYFSRCEISCLWTKSGFWSSCGWWMNWRLSCLRLLLLSRYFTMKEVSNSHN